MHIFIHAAFIHACMHHHASINLYIHPCFHAFTLSCMHSLSHLILLCMLIPFMSDSYWCKDARFSHMIKVCMRLRFKAYRPLFYWCTALCFGSRLSFLGPHMYIGPRSRHKAPLADHEAGPFSALGCTTAPLGTQALGRPSTTLDQYLPFTPIHTPFLISL